MGATFTTTRKEGNLLIAFTALFIPFVASRFWMITCLALHRHYSTSQGRDAVHHQRQMVLRNSSSPDSGLVSFLMMMWAWRSSSSKPIIRIAPSVLIAVLSISTFTLAGVFSSQISTAAGDEVLLNGNQCGFVSFVNVTSFSDMYQPISHTAKRLNDASNYAQQCYSTNSSGILDCNKFITRTLPTSVADYNASCPFSAGICRSNNTNVHLDTGYIDSNDMLGVNAPSDQRFAWRYVLDCAPLRTDGYKHSNGTYVMYDYGASNWGGTDNSTTENYTGIFPSVESQYSDPSHDWTGNNFKIR